MADTAASPSPWWYRARALLIGAAYGAGFFLGYLSLTNVTPPPAYVEWGRAGGDAGIAVLAWTGIALTLVAWLVRASGTAYLRRDVVFASDVQRDRLIVAGPFRYVRNPLYLGNVLMALGIGLYAPPLGFAIIVLGNVAIGVVLAREEARQLARRYGTVYEAFRVAVPAFVPRLTPATVAGTSSATPSVRSALLGESGCFGMALALVPIALFGNAGLPAFYAIWIVAIGSFFVVNRVRRRDSADIAR